MTKLEDRWALLLGLAAVASKAARPARQVAYFGPPNLPSPGVSVVIPSRQGQHLL